jgi:hypothetical protein
MNLNIIQTLHDKQLLGQFLKDPETWRSWFTFLRAFFALTPQNGCVELFKSCSGRHHWPVRPFSEAWLIIGTRGGKSFITALLAAYLAVFKRYELSPGEKGHIIIVAPSVKQAKIIKTYLSSFFTDNPLLAGYLDKELNEEIYLTNNIIISTLASNFRTIRGYTAIAAIVDEVAYLNIEGFAPDTEIIRALRSRLLSTDGPLICISSPYARRGMLWETYKRHYGNDDSQILCWQADSRTMNPTLSAEKIKQAYDEDAAGAAADYGAQFRADIEDFISADALEVVTIPGRYELGRVENISYQAFTDPSGGSKDAFTLAISHIEKGIRILDCIRYRTPPFSPEAVTAEFAKVIKSYALSTVTGDRYAGEWPREQFSKYGVHYIAADKSKSEIYGELLPLINSGKVELLDNELLSRQLLNLERRTSRASKDSIDHPPGAHDDIANAAAGALVFLLQSDPNFQIKVWRSQVAEMMMTDEFYRL